MGHRRPCRNFGRSQSGAGALEFAIVSPVLIALLFGILELGFAINNGATIGHAVEQAARSLIIDPNTTQSQLLAQVQAQTPGIPDGAISLSLNKSTTGSNAQIATVTWSYTYMTSLPYVPHDLLSFGSSVVVPLGGP